MQLVLLVLTLTAYGVAALVFYLKIVRATTGTFGHPGWARATLWSAAVLHLADIAYRSAVTATCPVTSAQFGLSLAALVAVVVFLLWARHDRNLALGLIVAPMGCGLFVASAVLEGHELQSNVPGWFLAVHVSASLLSVGLFVVAAAAALGYLVQSARLKAKRATISHATFPGLSTLESLGHRCLTWGLGPMTAGVVSGAVFAERLSHGGLESLRIMLSYACWLIAASVVIGQRITGWHGRRVAWGTIAAAAIAVLLVFLYTLMSGRPA